MKHLCAFCEKVEVPEENHICDACFKDEEAANAIQEAYVEWHAEQMRSRYGDINLFDNGVNKISVVYRRKKLIQWQYNSEKHTIFDDGRPDVMLHAKGYIEGWLDAIQILKGATQ